MAELTKMKESHATTQGEIKEFTARQSELDFTITQLSTKASEHDSRMSELGSKTSECDTRTSELNSRLSELDSKLVEIDTDMNSTVTNAISQMDAKFRRVCCTKLYHFENYNLLTHSTNFKHFIENMHEKDLAIVFSEIKDEIII